MKYKANHAGVRALGKSEGVGGAALVVAKKGVEAAKAIAPVVSGDYESSITARRQTVQAGQSNEDRAGAAYGSDSPYSAAVEKRHHTLAESTNRLRS